jgi:rhodanese-related sulfurtransferase
VYIAFQQKGNLCPPHATHPAVDRQAVSPDEVGRRRAQGLPTDLIDVRTPLEYAEVHAEGAQLIPLGQLDPRAVMAERKGPADHPLYLICKSGNRSVKAVEKFRQAGFNNAISVEGGTVAWEQAGQPVIRSSKKIISLERQVRIGAGLLVLLGVLLGWFVHPGFFGLSAFVGAGLTFAGITDWCGMGLLLAKMPWNNRMPPCDNGNGAACSR